MFTVHGRQYRSESEALARLKELAETNRLYGRSDGRVTEQSALFDALEAEAARKRAAAARPYVLLWRGGKGGQRKGRCTFATREAMSRWMWDPKNADKAVTYTN